MALKLMFVLFCLIYESSCVLRTLSSLDVSERFVSGVSSMYIIYIMHSLNFLLKHKLDFSFFESFIKIKSDVNFPFYKF